MYLPTIWNVQVVAAEHCLPRSLSYLHAPCGGNLMWWLWHRLQWRQWQEAKAAQVPLLFTIQMIFFFFCITFPFFSSKRDKVRARTHYALGWYETLVKYKKLNVLRQPYLSPPPLLLPHPHCIYSEQLNIIQFIGDSFDSWEYVFILTFSQQRYLLKCSLYSFRECDR